MNEISLIQFHQIMKSWLETKRIAIPFEYKLKDDYGAWLEYRDDKMFINVHYNPKLKGSNFSFTLNIEREHTEDETIQYYSGRLSEVLAEFEKYFFTHHAP